jgi:hypothetical protein
MHVRMYIAFGNLLRPQIPRKERYAIYGKNIALA